MGFMLKETGQSVEELIAAAFGAIYVPGSSKESMETLITGKTPSPRVQSSR